jgi:Ca2+-binding EF-hand superfamily protein
VTNTYAIVAAAAALAVAPAAVAAQQARTNAPAAAPAKQQVAPTRASLLSSLENNFKALDTNRDGSLSQAELAAAEARAQQQRLTAVRNRVDAQFTKLDTNRDGQLNKAEFMAAAPQKFAPATGAGLLAQLDKNKDKKVSTDEYRAPILTSFDRVDTNKDGTVSTAERQAAQTRRK